MQYITKIKLNAINNLSDARYASAAGIHYAGFNFNSDHPRYITPIKAKEIIDWLSGIFIVGEFGDAPQEQINEVGHLLNLDAVEVVVSTISTQVTGIDFPVFVRIHTGKFTSDELSQMLQTLYPQVACLVIEVTSDDLPVLQNILQPYMDKVFLELDIEAADYAAICETIQPIGICLNGGDEEQPGMKDFDQIADILEALSIEE
jgi:phosphoribosylanthranilate isomerase